jgi:hypothetical protein
MTNKNKKTFLKNFLATASAFAVLVGASADAMGASSLTTGGGFELGNNTNIAPAWVNGNNLIYGTNDAGKTGDINGHNIPVISVLGFAPADFTIEGNAGGPIGVTISRVVKNAGGTALPLVLANGSSVILDGTTYTGLGSVNGPGTMEITGVGFDYDGTIGANAALTEVQFNAGGNAGQLHEILAL